MSDKPDTINEMFITCPYCGWEDDDSWEKADEGKVECGHCDKEFTYCRNVDVNYSTEGLEEEEEKK